MCYNPYLREITVMLPNCRSTQCRPLQIPKLLLIWSWHVYASTDETWLTSYSTAIEEFIFSHGYFLSISSLKGGCSRFLHILHLSQPVNQARFMRFYPSWPVALNVMLRNLFSTLFLFTNDYASTPFPVRMFPPRCGHGNCFWLDRLNTYCLSVPDGCSRLLR